MYQSILDLRQTQQAIKFLKDSFERELSHSLHLHRVSAPLFVDPQSGLNDNLNGVERPVAFEIAHTGVNLEIVHSLAKWKRLALKRYDYEPGLGIYTDMNAIRRDETPDALHSVYVDQWDWERVILPEERTFETLRTVVERIYSSIKSVEWLVCNRFPELKPALPNEIRFISSSELLERYPGMPVKARENAIVKEYGAVFITQIGGKLADGQPHDGRAPDYDDWSLNGDILVWFEPLQCAVELSSMGIRVNAETLKTQLELSGHTERAALPYHQMLLNNELPQTIGGGIGQSRLCLVLLKKKHIGEVQVSFWPPSMIESCRSEGIYLL
ncbi:MAG: aspartate--ammonia ligase [Proteobacteria bacterium]|nr:aspartate--ammonia ligase [Pseudomonadota bacterium]